MHVTTAPITLLESTVVHNSPGPIESNLNDDAVMAYLVMAYLVMAYIVMAYTVMGVSSLT